MTKITNAQISDPPPPNCCPGKSYVPLVLCSLCFWWPTMQPDTITHVQNGSTMFPQNILKYWSIRLEPLSNLGWICPKLSPQTLKRLNPFSKCAQLPTSLIPLVRRIHRPPRSQWMVTKKCCRQIMPVSYHLALPSTYCITPTCVPPCVFAQACWWSERGGGRWPRPPTYHCRQQRGPSGARSPGLQTPGKNSTVSCGLGVYGLEKWSWVNSEDILDTSFIP